MTASATSRKEEAVAYARYISGNVRVKDAIQLGKRVSYFRGRKLIELLMDDSIKSDKKPACESEDDALKIGCLLLEHNLIHSSQVADAQKRILQPVNSKIFTADGYYTWVYEGSNLLRNVLLGLLMASLLGVAMFPIWPQSAKVGIWYISVTLLIILIGLIVVRLTVFSLCWCAGYDVWILPNFFDDDLGVADSLTPLYTAQKGEDIKDTWYLRAAGLVAVVSFIGWVVSQPSEWEEFMEKQKQFMTDLYDGNLLSDTADDPAASTRIPSLDEIMNDDDYAEEDDVLTEDPSDINDETEDPVEDMDID